MWQSGIDSNSGVILFIMHGNSWNKCTRYRRTLACFVKIILREFETIWNRFANEAQRIENGIFHLKHETMSYSAL